VKIPKTPKPFHELLVEAAKGKQFQEILTASSQIPLKKEEYLHWDELRHRKPPNGLSTEQWWLATKLRRVSGTRQIALRDKKGANFKFSVPDSVVEQLHHIDRGAGGLIGTLEPVTSPQTRDRYLIRSLIEESITSSQLEGAVTTREVAKQMLSSGRKPRDKSERMILNNYNTMQRIRVFITQSNVYHQLIYVSVYSRPCRSKGSLFDLPESHKREDCEVAMSSLEDYRNQTIQARASSRIRMDSTMARFEIG